MTFRGDDRAVSAVVGAVLIFAVLILALGVYQAQIVPTENEQVEYRHGQSVQQDLQELRNSLVGAASTGAGAPVSVDLGTRYPMRTFAVNPPPVYGEIESVPLGQASAVELSNVSALNDETADYLDGELTFDTKGLVYEADYHQRQNAPHVRYEHGTLYNDYEAGDFELTAGLVVDGGDITVVTLNASDFSKSGIDAVSVDPEALSAPHRSVRVADDGSGPLTLTLPTNATEDLWQELYADRPSVDSVSVNETANVATITLVDGAYDLQMAAVGVGEELERPGPAYLTLVENRSDQVVVEARDRYNNPVNTTVRTAGPFTETSKATGEDGQATFTVKPDTSLTSTSLHILDNSSDAERVPVTVRASVSGTYVVNLTATGLGCADTDECTLNTDEDGTSVDLLTEVTGDGDPITGARIDYARNNSSLGSVSSEETTVDGENTTTLSGLNENGTLRVYATSGDGADWVDIEVNATGGETVGSETRVTYVSNKELRTVRPDGSVTAYSTSQIKGIGPSTADLDDDGGYDVPYVNNSQDLRIIDAANDTATLDGSGSVDQSRVGIGYWDDDAAIEVLYTRSDSLYQVDADGSETEVLAGARAASGAVDFDGDGDKDIVYVDDNNEIRYTDQQGSSGTGTGVTIDKPGAISNPTDFDDDGTLEVAHYDGGDKGIDLVDSGGNDGSFDPAGSDVAQAPMAGVDWDDDGVSEVVYVSSDGAMYELDPVDGGTNEAVTDSGGTQISASKDWGAA